jgi:hypothetical protein
LSYQLTGHPAQFLRTDEGVFTLGVGASIFGHGEVTTALLLVAAWVINLTVAEWAIRKRPRRPNPPASLQVAMP